MKRVIALALGAAPAVLALALMPGDVKAGGSEAPDQKRSKRRSSSATAAEAGWASRSARRRGTFAGAVVRSVTPASAAEKAGLKEDDVIVRFDGEAVRGTSQLARLVEETPTGRPVAIEVRRGAATEKLTATLNEGDRRVHVYNRGGYPGVGDFDSSSRSPPTSQSPPCPRRRPTPPAPRRTRHIRRSHPTSGAGTVRTARTWSSACSAADRASSASSTWSSASSSPPTSSWRGSPACSSRRWIRTAPPRRPGSRLAT